MACWWSGSLSNRTYRLKLTLTQYLLHPSNDKQYIIWELGNEKGISAPGYHIPAGSFINDDNIDILYYVSEYDAMLHHTWFSSDRGLITFYHKIWANNSAQGGNNDCQPQDSNGCRIWPELLSEGPDCTIQYDLLYCKRAMTAQWNFHDELGNHHRACNSRMCISLPRQVRCKNIHVSYWLSFNTCAPTFSGMWLWCTTYFMVRFPLPLLFP